jgi:hypothetical protein
MKLDLHTHCGEAISIARYVPTIPTVERIVQAVKSSGLDGIAITEHHNRSYGFAVKSMVEQHSNNEIVIIPGQEIDQGSMHVVYLYLPGDITFKFVAHPGFPPLVDLATITDDSFHGIEIGNPLHANEIDEESVLKLASQHNLLLLRDSDAHLLTDLGRCYNEVDIEELCKRASCTLPAF